jgi:hypothetical protein
MDVERTMQFIVENLASVSTRLDKMAERESRMEERKSELEAQYAAWILAADERAKREIALIRAELRRGVRDSVEEQRRERARRREHEV